MGGSVSSKLAPFPSDFCSSWHSHSIIPNAAQESKIEIKLKQKTKKHCRVGILLYVLTSVHCRDTLKCLLECIWEQAHLSSWWRHEKPCKKNGVGGVKQRKRAQPNSHYLIEHIVRPEPCGSQSSAEKIRFWIMLCNSFWCQPGMRAFPGNAFLPGPTPPPSIPYQPPASSQLLRLLDREFNSQGCILIFKFLLIHRRWLKHELSFPPPPSFLLEFPSIDLPRNLWIEWIQKGKSFKTLPLKTEPVLQDRHTPPTPRAMPLISQLQKLIFFNIL